MNMKLPVPAHFYLEFGDCVSPHHQTPPPESGAENVKIINKKTVAKTNAYSPHDGFFVNWSAAHRGLVLTLDIAQIYLYSWASLGVLTSIFYRNYCDSPVRNHDKLRPDVFRKVAIFNDEWHVG